MAIAPEQSVIFAGGTILTMNDGSIPQAVAVVNGRICHLGSLADCRQAAGPARTEVDLEGGCLLPGFIDAHAHLLTFGQLRFMAELHWPKVRNIEELIWEMTQHAQKTPAGVTVRGHGYNNNLLEEGRHPTARDLDRVSRDRPVYVLHQSCHHVVANTAMLRLASIEAHTPDPPGGMILRDEHGNPTGVMLDAAARLIVGEEVVTGNHGPNFHIPEPLEDLVHMVGTGSDLYAAAGITTVLDPQVTRREMQAYLAAYEAGTLKTRLVMMYLSSYLHDLVHLGMHGTLGNAFVSFGPVKFYADGTLSGNTAAFSCAYCNDGSNFGYLYHTPDELAELIVTAHEHGFQTGTHAQGDVGIEAILRALEKAQKVLKRDDVRHRIEHCGIPTDAQLTRIRDLGVWPIMQPRFVAEFGDGVVPSIGEERANRWIPLNRFKQLGIPWAMSTDSPVTDYRPLLAIEAAVRRLTVSGRVLGEDLAVSVMDTLRAYTSVAAASMHREHDIGSIEAGKCADLVVLNRNPATAPVDEIPGIRVKQTWVAGKRVFG